MVTSKGMSVKLPDFICRKFPFTKWEWGREELWASLVQGPEGPTGLLSSLRKYMVPPDRCLNVSLVEARWPQLAIWWWYHLQFFSSMKKTKQPDYLPHLSLLQTNAGSEGWTLPAEVLLHEWATWQGSACSCGHTNIKIKMCIVIAGYKLSKGNSQLCKDGLS